MSVYSPRFASVDLPAKPRKRKAKPRPSVQADNLRRWATCGVGLSLALSVALNGYANALHSTSPIAAWALGIVIPVFVLILGKTAGILFHRDDRRLAAVLGAICCGVLALSIWHCALGISLLAGSPLPLALPMAVAIDAGMVALEIAALTA